MCAVTIPFHGLYVNWIDSNSRVNESVNVAS